MKKSKKLSQLFKRKKLKSRKFFKVINFRNISLVKILAIIEVIGLTYIICMLFFDIPISFPFIKTSSDISEYDSIDMVNSSDENALHKEKGILSSEDLESFNSSSPKEVNKNLLDFSVAELNNTKNMVAQNYTIDEKTAVVYELFDFNAFMEKDFKISNKRDGKPKVLIFHTHGGEVYADSKGQDEGVIGLGNLLEKEFEEVYGIETLHITNRFDLVDGQTQILGAYERMNEVVSKIIEENPSIEVVIDLHRDGLPDDVKVLTTIDNVNYAPIMFVNGLSSLKKGDTIQSLTDLPNPNLQDNLAFSFQVRTTGNTLYNDLFKKIYLHAYRYSLHYKGRSLLVEIGAQTNTWEEAKNSVKPLAKTLSNVLQ